MSTAMRPPSFSLSLQALLTLPMRICNPPPAASRVRSCKLTPLINVTLDDVLNKRHLPPLTLKDFEEWLVFVEGNSQYLYFILWLKEYESRYAAWLTESGCALPTGSPTKFASTTSLSTDVDPDTPCPPRDRDLSYINLIPSSAPLALFFTRAKQTFLDPASSSPYALGPAALFALTPSTHSLTPSIPQFTMPEAYGGSGVGLGALPPALASQPHPHPKELAPLATYARKVLKESLERFATTACQNVGSRRAWCGIAGGSFIILVMGILPALAAFFFAPSRWWRTVGWFGCWLGGTIVVSSLHGICMMIYIFGDLRQLRSFELARPSISGPRAIARARPRLKSFFTRDKEEESDTGDTGTGTGIDSAPVQPSAPVPAREINKPAMLTPVLPDDKGVKKPTGKRPWSATSASETSTGTPVVCFGPGAFRFGVGIGTMESEVSSATTETAELCVGSVESAAGAAAEGRTDIENDFGIEISPAYYYAEPGPAAEEEERADRRESVRSAGSGSKIGLVMRWVLGKRGSVGAGTGTGTVLGEKTPSLMNEKATQGQLQTRSHAGTFGIRSWRGGLGSLPEHSGADGRDLEKGLAINQTMKDEKLLDGPELPDANAALEFPNSLTAEFITHDYPQSDSQCCGVACSIPVPVVELDERKGTHVKEERVSFPISPVKFDFDKLPAVAAARRMSSPCTFASSPVSPFPDSERALSPPQPLLLHPPPPALYAHPGARLATPSPAPAPIGPGSKPVPTARDRQWWDTCPRHPAVEATLATQTRPPALAIQTNNLPRPTSLLAHIHPTSYTSTEPDSFTRPTSPASSDVHSRVRVKVRGIDASATTSSYVVTTASMNRKSTARSKVDQPGATWRTRFRRVMAVPAFGPLTRVLEPAVSRGQWEIVVRSSCVAALGTWIMIGCLVALPEIR